MTPTQIHETLDKMLNDVKSKNFLNHLIRAYYPKTKVSFVSEKPKFYKCVISKDNLLSCADIEDEKMRDEFKNHFQSTHLNLFGVEGTNSPINMENKNAYMGITGLDTTTYMSMFTYKEFNAWLIAKIAAKDKHITWIVNSIRTKEQEQRKESAKYTTYSMGDLDAFKRIKIKY